MSAVSRASVQHVVDFLEQVDRDLRALAEGTDAYKLPNPWCSDGENVARADTLRELVGFEDRVGGDHRDSAPLNSTSFDPLAAADSAMRELDGASLIGVISRGCDDRPETAGEHEAQSGSEKDQ